MIEVGLLDFVDSVPGWLGPDHFCHNIQTESSANQAYHQIGWEHECSAHVTNSWSLHSVLGSWCITFVVLRA